MMMGTFSIWHWTIVALVLAVMILPFIWGAMICQKAGYSRLWTFTQLIPLVGLIFIWIFAFAEWPNLKKPAAAGGSGAGPDHA